MIPVPVSALLVQLAKTKGKSPDQLEVESEVRLLLAKRALPDITEPELEALYEQAGMEVALRAVAERMKAKADAERMMAKVVGVSLADLR